MYKYIKDFNIQFLLPIIVMVIIFLELTVSLINNQYMKNNSLNELKDNILIATYISKVVHEIQKERGLSAGYITNKAQKFKISLNLQRKNTNKKITILKNFLKSHGNDTIKAILEKSLKSLDNMNNIRKKIETLEITTKDAISVYSKNK